MSETPGNHDLLGSVKANLIVDHDEDDTLIVGFIVAATSYAESFQHLEAGHYDQEPMPGTTRQAVVMLASHFYESRDGSTAGFFGDNPAASTAVWQAIDRLLRLDRHWKT